MCYHLALFVFGSQIDYLVVFQVYPAVCYLAVGRLDKSEIVYFGVYAQ